MRKRFTIPILATLLALPATAGDRRVADKELVRSMRASHVKNEGANTVVWTPARWSEAQRRDVARMLDEVVPRVEGVLSKSFDADAYGEKQIEYFVVEGDEIPSHVYGGYEHDPAADDPPVVFLSGLDSGEAPYIHETAHIVGGPFGSLLLREGLATYVQFAVKPGAMRPLVKMGDVSDTNSLNAALARLLGRPEVAAKTAAWLANPEKDGAFATRADRGLFYAISASFTAFLVERIGIEAFMHVYAAEDAKAALTAATRKPWGDWVAEWLQTTRPQSSG